MTLAASSPAAARGTAAEILEVHEISMRFGGLRVFEGISLQLHPGQVLGVIGPNGAGKTTLINVVSGMLTPTSGRVLLGGEDITQKPLHVVSRLGVVRSFQQTNTYRDASVEENLHRAQRFSATGDGPGPDLRLGELLEEFSLARHLEARGDTLPYGLQKMLGLVMVLATRPKFILMDEPAAGLERRERVQVDRFIAHAQRVLGCGVLIVEHDMDLVRRLCPQIVVVEAGRVLAQGAPAEVLSRPEVIDAYLGTGGD